MLWGGLCVILTLSFAVFLGNKSQQNDRQQLIGGLWFFLFGGMSIVILRGTGDLNMLMASCLNQLSVVVFLISSGVGGTPRVLPERSKLLVWGLCSFAIGVGAVLFSMASLTLFEFIGIGHQEQDLMTFMVEGDSWEKGVALLLIVGLAPVGEELLFRGVIQKMLIPKMGLWPGIVITGTLFGLMHFDSWTAVPPLIVFGIVLCWWREHTGWVLFPVLVHFANNSMAMLLV